MGTDYQLTKIQKEKIKEEMKTVDSMHNLGLKNIEETEDISTIVNELFFTMWQILLKNNALC
jgi:hypothetical protein